MSKAIVCSCEDVTARDIAHAIDKGYRDIESIKRYTGLGTGICQGKSCLNACARLVAAAKQTPREAILPFTPRPPFVPTQLGHLAALPFDADAPPGVGSLDDIALGHPALAPPEPLPAKASVVIVGGGIMGLALAYNLSLLGVRDVVVLEKGYLCAGASGRNGGGVRMQWGTSANIELARRSIHLMKDFAGQMGINVWLRQGGYLFLARSASIARKLERSAALHHRHGVNTQIITPDAARDIVPGLTLKDIELCAFNREDGVIFPWPFLWGYANKAKENKVRVETFTSVTGFEIHQGLVRKVKTDRGEIACEQVVVACGAWSPEIAALAGVRLPNEPHRHEICSTEPLKPFLGPLVSVLDSGLYFSQSMRGEIVGGMGDPLEPAELRMGSTLRFLRRFSAAMIEQMPQLKTIKVLRQWAGCYDVTPDNNPILGKTPGLANMLQMSGFVGHGFMMAPAVAERMAGWMVENNSDELFERFNLSRFSGGPLQREDMIIG